MFSIVVFDTNVLISAVLSQRSSPYRCLELAKQGRVQSVTCQEILEEFEEKLQGKFAYSSELAQAKVQEILNYSQLVTITNTLDSGITDPDDNMILECAVVGGATHIVTGDKRHLLPLGTYQGISIINAADFLTLVSSA